METSVIHLPCIQFLVDVWIKDTHDILFGYCNWCGNRAYKEVQALCSRSFLISTFFLSGCFSIIDLNHCVHTVRRCGNDRYTIHRRYLCLNAAFRKCSCRDFSCKFQFKFHDKIRCCLTHQCTVISLSYCFNSFFQLTQRRGSCCARCISTRYHTCFISRNGLGCQLTDTVCINFWHNLCSLKFSHSCCRCSYKVVFVDINRIQLEETASVLCHFLSFVFQRNGSLLVAVITVIVSHSLYINLRDFNLCATVIDHLSGIGIHPACSCLLHCDLIQCILK